MPRKQQQSASVPSKAAATSQSDKQRLIDFAEHIAKFPAPKFSEEVDAEIELVMTGAAEELRWIADELDPRLFDPT